MSAARPTNANQTMGNAPAHADVYVAIDARVARKRRAAANDDNHDGVLGGDYANPRPKRLRTSVKVKTEMPDAMLVGDAPAAGGDGLPATRTPATARAGITATPSAAGCEWSATPLDFDAPAPVAGLPLESKAFATPLNFDWAPTATATAATTPMELHARAGPLDADNDANVDPTLVAVYEANRPHVLLDEKRQFNSLWVEHELPTPLELPGTDGYVLRPYGMHAKVDADNAPTPEDEDYKPRVPLDLASGHALDERATSASAPLDLGMRVAAHVLEDELANIDPALMDADCKPYAPLHETRAAPLDLQATNTHTPHADNVAQLLAPAHADAPKDERTPYVPFNEKLSYITEWRRRVVQGAPAPLELPVPLELPAPAATVPGAYYRPDGVRIPVGDTRTRDWVPLPPYGAAPDEVARYDGMALMSPKTKRELEEFLAAYEPAFPRARVEMGLLTPEEEPGPAMDPALLDALLFDLTQD